MHVTLTPAYGKDYKTAQDALSGWAAGKDWLIESPMSRGCGRYCSIQDVKFLKEEGFVEARLRFAKKTNSVDVTL